MRALCVLVALTTLVVAENGVPLEQQAESGPRKAGLKQSDIGDIPDRGHSTEDDNTVILPGTLHPPVAPDHQELVEGAGEDDLEQSSYDSAEDNTIASDYSESVPSWIADDFYDHLRPDGDDANTGMNDALYAEIESALVNEKLDPLYRSISHLKSLLTQLREKATIDLEDIGESVAEEEDYSFYSSSGSESNTWQENDMTQYNHDSEVLENQPNEHPESQVAQDDPSNNNSTDYKPNNAVESAMNEFHEKHEKVVFRPQRRFKRDLGWKGGNRQIPSRANDARAGADMFSTSSDFQGGEGDLAGESPWSSSSSEAGFIPDTNDIAERPFNYRQRIRAQPRKETNWRDVFLNLRGNFGSTAERLDRRRRNKEDLRAFVNSMPTLEGMRKRMIGSFDTSPADPPAVPDTFPTFPTPPDLPPPPDNIIHPALPPSETLPWVPDPDFEEDNALYEEQTNGLMTNPYRRRYEYLKDVERSIMQESLEDLALQLAGRHPDDPEEAALRVRRVMQIPPPPPYGRKVVKSLYRKKAYGFPFIEDELADPWESEEETFDAPYNDGYNDDDLQDLESPNSWGDVLQFGRVEDPDEGPRLNLRGRNVLSLLTAIKTERAKDKILEDLLTMEEVPAVLQRWILLQALAAEAEASQDGEEDENDGSEGPNAAWGTFQPQYNMPGGTDGEGDDGLDGTGNRGGSDGGSSVSDQQFMSEDGGGGDWRSFVDEIAESESETSLPEWADMRQESQPNIPDPLEEMKQRILIKKFAQLLQRVTHRAKREKI